MLFLPHDGGRRGGLLVEQGVGEGFEVGKVAVFHAAADGDEGTYYRAVFHLTDHLGHDSAGGGGPRTVLDEAEAAALVALDLEVIEEVVHGREEACIVGGGTEREGGVAEGVFDGFGLVVAREVGYSYFGGAFLLEDVHQLEGCLAGASVYAGVGYEDAFGFGLVAAPEVVETDGLGEVAACEHGPVEGRDGLYV